MKLPTLLKKRKLRTTAQRLPRQQVIDDYDQEPNMKLSSAFIVVLVLHVVAVGGIYAFSSIKAHRNADADSAEKMMAPAKAAAPAADAVASPAPAAGDTHPVQDTGISNKIAPKTVKQPGPAAKGAVEFYTVVKGDTPVAIARKLGVSSEELLKLNKIEDPKKLRIGQKLRVPAKTAKASQMTRAES